MKRLRLVVLGMMGQCPFGGQTWLYLNWLRGLHRLREVPVATGEGNDADRESDGGSDERLSGHVTTSCPLNGALRISCTRVRASAQRTRLRRRRRC